MKIKFKEDQFGILSKQLGAAATINRRKVANIADLISSSLRCHQPALLQLMTFRKIFAMAIVVALVIGFPLHASSDSKSGKRAWEVGHGEVIEILMETGANVNIPRSKGKSAVKLATTRYGELTSETTRKYELVIQAPQRGMLYAQLQGEREEQEKLMQMYPAGTEIQDCDVCPRMVVVPPGAFLMGSPASEKGRWDSEGPQHRVTISYPFAVGKYEVTFREWDACASNGGCSHRPDDAGWGRGNRPVIYVSWHDAQEYVSWLSRKTGEQYRLLSESEWEYVARAGTTGPFHFGSTISTDLANYNGHYSYSGDPKGIYRNKTVSVGSFPTNRFELHDVHGNAWEWVEDCWHVNYHDAPLDGGAWVTRGDCNLRVLRGGGWYDLPRDLRSAVRVRNEAGVLDDRNGFRVARTLTP